MTLTCIHFFAIHYFQRCVKGFKIRKKREKGIEEDNEQRYICRWKERKERRKERGRKRYIEKIR